MDIFARRLPVIATTVSKSTLTSTVYSATLAGDTFPGPLITGKKVVNSSKLFLRHSLELHSSGRPFRNQCH